MSDNTNINVSSNNQSGGITAGIVNIIKEHAITLSNEDRAMLIKTLGHKNNVVHVSLQSGGSSNLTALAQDIKKFLFDNGFINVKGVNTIFGFQPFKGIAIEEKPNNVFVVFIGSLQ